MKKLSVLLAFGLFFLLSCNKPVYNIGERTIVFYDSERSRPVVTEFWYPTPEDDQKMQRNTDLPFVLPSTIRDGKIEQNKYPLILLSHGTGGNRFGLAWLATVLAKEGYIVAAPDHWGNTFDNVVPEYFLRYWERPLDVSFIIDKP